VPLQYVIRILKVLSSEMDPAEIILHIPYANIILRRRLHAHILKFICIVETRCEGCDATELHKNTNDENKMSNVTE
jgi:hypothetical protein